MKILMLFIVFTIVASCSSTKQVSAPQGENSSFEYDESFDPNSLNDDDIIITKIETKVADTKKTGSESQVSEGEIKYREASGFRVQLLATKNIETATLTEQEAKDIFISMKHTIYLVFDAPQYKVRVGDFLNRNDAEEVRDIAKDYGYRDAFIVIGKINVPVNGSF